MSVMLFTIPIVLSDNPGLIKSGVPIRVSPGAGQQSGSALVGPGTCGNNLTSCGFYPNCFDISKLSYCTNGRVYTTYCSSNVIKNQSKTQTCNTTGLIGGFTFQLNVTNGKGAIKEINMKLFRPGTSSLFSSGTISGDGLVAVPSNESDMQFDFDNKNLNVVIYGLNVSQLSGVNEIVIDKPPVAINGVFVYRAYHVKLPPSFLYSNITISILYGDTSATNDANLKFYRCSDFNVETNSCNTNWEVLTPTTLDAGHKIATLSISGFSVYVLGETAPQTTTTTTTSSTTTTTSTYTPTTSTTSSTTTTTSTQYSSSNTGSSSSGSSSVTTSKTTTVTTTVFVTPTTQTTSTTTNTTNITAPSNVSSNDQINLTGFSFLGANPYLIVIPIATAAGYFAWKYYLIERFMQPRGRNIVVYRKSKGKVLTRKMTKKGPQLVLS